MNGSFYGCCSLHSWQNSVNAFENGFGQRHNICDYELIAQSRFHAKAFVFK